MNQRRIKIHGHNTKITKREIMSMHARHAREANLVKTSIF